MKITRLALIEKLWTNWIKKMRSHTNAWSIHIDTACNLYDMSKVALSSIKWHKKMIYFTQIYREETTLQEWVWPRRPQEMNK